MPYLLLYSIYVFPEHLTGVKNSAHVFIRFLSFLKGVTDEVFEYRALNPIFSHKALQLLLCDFAKHSGFYDGYAGFCRTDCAPAFKDRCHCLPGGPRRRAAQAVINHRNFSETCVCGLRTTAHSALGI